MAYSKVLVGTDGSLTAAKAVQRAVDLAVATDATLVVAFVGDSHTGQGVLDQVVAQHGGAGVSVETHLLEGDPAEALLGLAAAEGIDIVVVGNKGMTGASRFLLGSVPNKISHQASCDVLIVNTTGAG